VQLLDRSVGPSGVALASAVLQGATVSSRSRPHVDVRIAAPAVLLTSPAARWATVQLGSSTAWRSDVAGEPPM
jgi:hypothetical protein